MAKFKPVNREMLQSVAAYVLRDDFERANDEEFIRLYNLVMWCSRCRFVASCCDFDDCPYREVMLSLEDNDD